jgi:hypothetical protein
MDCVKFHAVTVQPSDTNTPLRRCRFADTGNEGPITAFWAANGFMVEYLAPKWGAMLVFPEERYYGTSLPFGDASFQAENLKYLTTDP